MWSGTVCLFVCLFVCCIYFVFMCMGVLLTCVYVWAWYPWTSKGDIASYHVGAGSWTQLLLTAKPSLQPLTLSSLLGLERWLSACGGRKEIPWSKQVSELWVHLRDPASTKWRVIEYDIHSHECIAGTHIHTKQKRASILSSVMAVYVPDCRSLLFTSSAAFDSFLSFK